MAALSLLQAQGPTPVLLHPSSAGAPLPKLPQLGPGQRYTVGVLGLHGSGTHALIEYLAAYFDVQHEPKKRGSRKKGNRDDGTLHFSSTYKLWKHSVPLSAFDVPTADADGCPVVLLLTIREVRSWMRSLSDRPYELHRMQKGKRKQGQVHWMLEDVYLRTCAEYWDRSERKTFESVPQLWACYAHGYTEGTFRAGSGPPCFIIRHEDIVQRPGDVMGALEAVGLPRSATPFEPIERSVAGTGRSRQELLERMSQPVKDGFDADPSLLRELRNQMKPYGVLLERLGYSMP